MYNRILTLYITESFKSALNVVVHQKTAASLNVCYRKSATLCQY